MSPVYYQWLFIETETDDRPAEKNENTEAKIKTCKWFTTLHEELGQDRYN